MTIQNMQRRHWNHAAVAYSLKDHVRETRTIERTPPTPPTPPPYHAFEDPDVPGLNDDALLAIFRRVRDEIGAYCRELMDSLYSDP